MHQTILALASASALAVSPPVVAAAIVAFLLNATQLIDAAKGLWGYFLPTRYQWIPGVVITSSVTIEQALSNGVTTWVQLVVPFLFAAGAFVPGAKTAAHSATEDAALSLAAHSELSPDAQRQAKRTVVTAQRGPGAAARLVGMALMLLFVPLAIVGCTPGQVAAVQSVVAGVANAVAHDTTLLNGLQQDANDVFDVAPDAKLQAAVNLAFGDVRDALEALGAAADGTGAAAQRDVKTAAEKFKVAWDKLAPLLQQAHVLKAPGVRSNGSVVAQPLSLRYAS